MTRRTVMLAALLTLIFVSGCGWRDRPRLLGRWRDRTPDCTDYAPYARGYGLPPNGQYFGAAPAMPCSMGEGLPIMTVPGGITAPGGEVIMPQPLPNGMMPPLQPPGTVTPPGSAPPKPADPSADPSGLRKPNGLTNAKPVSQGL